jgi:hypothetical protein
LRITIAASWCEARHSPGWWSARYVEPARTINATRAEGTRVSLTGVCDQARATHRNRAGQFIAVSSDFADSRITHLRWSINLALTAWSTASRRTGPADAGTPTCQLKIDDTLDIFPTRRIPSFGLKILRIGYRWRAQPRPVDRRSRETLTGRSLFSEWYPHQ